MKTESVPVLPAQVAERGSAACGTGSTEGALLQSTHAWVDDLPDKLRLFLDRLYSAWVVQNYARHYAHHVPWDLPLPGDARPNRWRLAAAEWMARTSKLPRLLCDIECWHWHEHYVCQGLLQAPRDAAAPGLARGLLAPGALYDLFSWLRQVRLLDPIPAAWLAVLPVAPGPSEHHWTSWSSWHSGYFQVEVVVGGFDDRKAADHFGNAAAILQFLQGKLVLAHSCFAALRLADANVRVRVLRQEARRKSVVDDLDFEPFAVGIREFGRHGDLSGSFGSLAYRTVEGGSQWSDGK